MKHRLILTFTIFLTAAGTMRAQDSLLFVKNKNHTLFIKKWDATDLINSEKYRAYITAHSVGKEPFMNVSFEKINDILREVFPADRIAQVRNDNIRVSLICNGKGQTLQVIFQVMKQGITQIRPDEFLLLDKKFREQTVAIIIVAAAKELEMLPAFNFPLFYNYR